MNIQDYNNLIAFKDSSEFDIRIEKKASFKDNVNTFRKNMTVGIVDTLSNHN